MKIDYIKPENIEKRSMEIIENELENLGILLDQKHAPIVKRVIHTTADFEFSQTLSFSENAVEKALNALKNGATIVTDTTMTLSGINKQTLEKLGCKAVCFMGDSEIAKIAKENGTTKAIVAVEKAREIEGNVIFSIGNAPTALIRLYELICENKISPSLIIGVPVGFVNVVNSKELIMSTDVPYIVNKGRKGGSTVAAAIINALMYMILREK